MSIILLCKDCIEARYIAHVIHKEGLLSIICVESRKHLIWRRILLTLRKKSLWRYPMMLIDIVFVEAFHFVTKRLLVSKCFDYDKPFPANIPTRLFNNVNSHDCASFLKSLAPDIIVVIGTSIIKEPSISIPCRYMLNIHAGIVPEYRNVQSEFWAYYQGDLSNIGTSIIHLDTGIDTGNIAVQGRLSQPVPDGLVDIKDANLRLAGELIINTLKLAQKRSLPRHPQERKPGAFYKTLRAKDVIGFLKCRNLLSPSTN